MRDAESERPADHRPPWRKREPRKPGTELGPGAHTVLPTAQPPPASSEGGAAPEGVPTPSPVWCLEYRSHHENGGNEDSSALVGAGQLQQATPLGPGLGDADFPSPAGPPVRVRDAGQASAVQAGAHLQPPGNPLDPVPRVLPAASAPEREGSLLRPHAASMGLRFLFLLLRSLLSGRPPARDPEDGCRFINRTR